MSQLFPRPAPAFCLSTSTLLLCGVIMSFYFVETDQWGEVEVEDGERTLVSLAHSSWEKKAYLCSAVDLRLSVRKPLETPSALHLSILSPIHSSLHHWLPSSYAYLLLMLQGFSPHRDALRGSGMTTQSSQITDRWLMSLAVFKQAQMLSYFSLGSGSWLDLSLFLFFLNGLQGLSELPLSELKCNISIEDIWRILIRFASKIQVLLVAQQPV